MPLYPPDAAWRCPECGSVSGRPGKCKNHEPGVERERADELAEALTLDERS